MCEKDKKHNEKLTGRVSPHFSISSYNLKASSVRPVSATVFSMHVKHSWTTALIWTTSADRAGPDRVSAIDQTKATCQTR
jgi:hypothetical protein